MILINWGLKLVKGWNEFKINIVVKVDIELKILEDYGCRILNTVPLTWLLELHNGMALWRIIHMSIWVA